LLAAKNNYKEICKQINKYNPIYFVIANPAIFKKVKKKFKNKKTKILDDYKKIKVKAKSDVTISAIPGTEGLLPTLSIIKSTKKLLLANKESVICGWELIKNESFKYKVDIVPIDSEHYSILQLIKDYKIDQIKKIYLTCIWRSLFKLQTTSI
jgi:1-deoxy-D-xylulose-5-phosphate reductoisomerase